ncbi:MAG: 50S ribosomal protein L11 methyltransferase [Bacteroidales bacterium]|nr:50S ribosomal protein L11 methyltransferase [Bacteroidales bacterium]
MDYIELRCKIAAKDVRTISDILIAELNEIGYESYDETEEGVNAYILEKFFDLEKVNQLQANQIADTDIVYEWEVIETQNWNEVWESNFEPIVVEQKCIIRAPFHTNTPKCEYEIIIEPKMSFGTGHHETTFLMLKTILDLDLQGKNVLDMGCGTGVLAILAKLKGATDITAIDIDEWAYNNAVENVQKNNCSDIKVLQGDASLLTNQQFDVIIANINRNILMDDIKNYAKVLKSGGVLLLSGLYDKDLPMIKTETDTNRLDYISHIEKNSWIAARFTKM